MMSPITLMDKVWTHYQIKQYIGSCKTLYIKNFLPIRSGITIVQLIPEITMRIDWFNKLLLRSRMQVDKNPNYQEEGSNFQLIESGPKYMLRIESVPLKTEMTNKYLSRLALSLMII